MCSVCHEKIPDVYLGPMSLRSRPHVARKCPNCGWICCYRCDPIFDGAEEAHICPGCKQFRSEWSMLTGEVDRWIRGGLEEQWRKDRQSDRWVTLRKDLMTPSWSGLTSFAELAAKAKTWQQVAAAFIRAELGGKRAGEKDRPDFARLKEVADGFQAPMQHGIWITIAEKCRQLNCPIWAWYAYSEAVVADPTSSSIAWDWMRKLMEEVKAVVGDKMVADKLLVAVEDLDLAYARPSRSGDQEAVPKLAAKYRTLALKFLEKPEPAPPSQELKETLERPIERRVEPKEIDKTQLRGIQANEINEAARTGNVERVKALLKKSPELITAKEKYGHTPLHQAVLQGRAEMVKLLLAQGADVNAQNNVGCTPLYYAASWGYTEIAELLLAKGADVNAQTKDGETPLQHAALGGYTEIAELLLAKGADVNAQNREGYTASQLAEQRWHSGVMELLRRHEETLERPIERRVEPKEIDKTQLRGIRANEINKAAGTGNVERVKALLKKEPGLVNAGSNVGNRPLHEAARSGYTEVVELLLAHGADVEIQNQGYRTPLHWAAGSGRTEVVKLLLAHGANVNAADKWGDTILHWAVLRGHVDVMRVLLAHGANVNTVNYLGWTPLHTAAGAQNLEVARLLLTHGANANALTKKGETPLFLAMSKRNTEVVELLRSRK